MNRVGDKLQPCLNPLVTLKAFVIRFPIFNFDLAPLYNDFIATINLLLKADLSRVSHNLFNGVLSYAFVKSINIKCNSLLVAFFFISFVLCRKFYLYLAFQLENLIVLPSPYYCILILPVLLIYAHKFFKMCLLLIFLYNFHISSYLLSYLSML